MVVARFLFSSSWATPKVALSTLPGGHKKARQGRAFLAFFIIFVVSTLSPSLPAKRIGSCVIVVIISCPEGLSSSLTTLSEAPSLTAGQSIAEKFPVSRYFYKFETTSFLKNFTLIIQYVEPRPGIEERHFPVRYRVIFPSPHYLYTTSTRPLPTHFRRRPINSSRG